MTGSLRSPRQRLPTVCEAGVNFWWQGSSVQRLSGASTSSGPLTHMDHTPASPPASHTQSSCFPAPGSLCGRDRHRPRQLGGKSVGILTRSCQTWKETVWPR